ncbi:MAG: diadenylate cyclase [Pirellulaceae bacterium]
MRRSAKISKRLRRWTVRLSSRRKGSSRRVARIIEVSHADLTLSKGLGARHWAGAAISQITKAIGIVVSQSTGTVRLFQNGDTVLRIEPMDHAVKWQEFNYDPPTSAPES